MRSWVELNEEIDALVDLACYILKGLDPSLGHDHPDNVAAIRALMDLKREHEDLGEALSRSIPPS